MVYSRHMNTRDLLNNPAPNFILPNHNGTDMSLSNFSDTWLVLYFYPKNDTPGCTKEACGFRDEYTAIKNMRAEVIGVSRDDTDSHAKFIEKYHLPFMLLSDTTGKTIEKYGALGLAGGIKRMTYIINPKGHVVKIYSKVTPASHADMIVQDLALLQKYD